MYEIAGPYIGVSPAQSIRPATDKVVSVDMYNNVEFVNLGIKREPRWDLNSKSELSSIFLRWCEL